MQPFIPHFIQEQYVANCFKGSIEGCVLFVDISGFTQMTQQLMDKGQKEGAEVLSNILNSIFEVMVKEVYHAQGFITHYAGDAFTSIFPLSDSPQNTAIAALQCAQTIQDFFRKNGTQHSKFGSFDLQVKIGLSYGETNWGIVGDENIMDVHACKFYFRGQAISEAALVEQKAQKGQTMLSQSFRNTLKETALKGRYIAPRIFCYEGIEAPSKIVFPPSRKPNLPKIQAEILNRFIPSEVAAFREKGEFRNIVSVFISFKGIDSHDQINLFTSIVLKHIIRYKGDLKEIDFGDKGAIMVGFFGAPVTHEDDLARALYFVEEVANEIQGLEVLKNLKFRIGITTGKVYAGILGGKYRCEYTCLGSIVNMAARIMTQTDWQQIWVNENIAAHPHFTFQKRGTFPYKGFAAPIPTYQYLGKAKNNTIYKNDTQLIGHDETLTKLNLQITSIFEGKPAGISYIFGEAGIGKTRLVYALKEQTETQVKWVHIAANQILQKPFQPFKDMLSNYFLSPHLEGKIEQQEHFEAVFERLLQQLREKTAQIEGSQNLQSEPSKHFPPIVLFKDAETELLRTKSILAALVGLQYTDTILQQLDAKGRYENTILAIKNLLKAFALVEPLIIHLEDSQWLDTDSITLLQRLVSNLNHYPITILSTARYKDDGSQAVLPLKDIQSHTIELTYLEPSQVKILAETLLNQHNNETIPISESFLQVLVERSKGNPFFVEQLLRFFGENQWLQFSSGTWKLTQEGDSIPDSIQALLMARIDRLSKQVKEVVKVAAVIGREFDIHLLSMLLQRNVLAETKVAETEQIWLLLQDLKGIFKHTLLRDMAYDMQLKERLRQLHQFTGASMEKLFQSNLQEKYTDIAFHYEQAEATIKTIEYLEKAGDYAQENFQNQQALSIFERLLKQLKKLKDKNFTWKILLKKATILRVIGKWDAAYEVYQEAKKLAIGLQNQDYQNEIQFNLARIFSLQGKYQTSLDYYQQSLEVYRLTENKMQIAKTVGFMGVIYINLSQYEEAAKCFQQQIALASELDDPKNHATALGNLGSLFNQSGNYQAALDCYQKSYDLFESTGWPQNAAMNLANMGTVATIQDDYDAAMDYYQQSLERFEKVGYQHGMAYTTVNIGYTLMQKGLYAETIPYYEKSLRLSLEMNDRRLRAFTEGNIGIVYYHQSEYKQALEYLEKAIEGHQKIGFKHSLGEWYWGKAICLYELAFYEKALDWVEQSIEVSKAISRTEIVFKSQLLKGQIQFRMGEESTAITHFNTLLENSEQKEEQAQIHFELWRLYDQKSAEKERKTHYQNALQLFEQLNTAKSKRDYELKIRLLKTSLETK